MRHMIFHAVFDGRRGMIFQAGQELLTPGLHVSGEALARKTGQCAVRKARQEVRVIGFQKKRIKLASWPPWLGCGFLLLFFRLRWFLFRPGLSRFRFRSQLRLGTWLLFLDELEAVVDECLIPFLILKHLKPSFAA
jgi:hypothetical protein